MNRISTSALLALSLTLAAAAPSAFAQAQQDAPQQTAPMQDGRMGHHHAPDPHKEAMHLSKKLGLSADQEAKLEPIFQQRHDQMMAIRSNTSLSPDQKHAQMHDLMKSTHDQLSSVLTPDQMQQMKQMRREHRKGTEQGAGTPSGM